MYFWTKSIILTQCITYSILYSVFYDVSLSLMACTKQEWTIGINSVHILLNCLVSFVRLSRFTWPSCETKATCSKDGWKPIVIWPHSVSSYISSSVLFGSIKTRFLTRLIEAPTKVSNIWIEASAKASPEAVRAAAKVEPSSSIIVTKTSIWDFGYKCWKIKIWT